MRKVWQTFLLLALAAVAAGAQERAAGGGARLADSFGAVPVSDMLARLDNFAVELQNEPAARGLVVAYAAKNKFPGWPLQRARFAVNYLVESRLLDRTRVSAVNGGLRDDTAFELWVVGPGAGTPVKPFDLSLLMSGEKTALPFDRFVVVEDGDQPLAEVYEATPSPDSAEIYEYFAAVLRSDPALRGCVIGYTSRRGRRTADRRIAARGKLTIAKAHAVDVRRLFAVGGGRREYKMVELWLVPPGAPLPTPTPDPLPGRRSRRP